MFLAQVDIQCLFRSKWIFRRTAGRRRRHRTALRNPSSPSIGIDAPKLRCRHSMRSFSYGYRLMVVWMVKLDRRSAIFMSASHPQTRSCRFWRPCAIYRPLGCGTYWGCFDCRPWRALVVTHYSRTDCALGSWSATIAMCANSHARTDNVIQPTKRDASCDATESWGKRHWFPATSRATLVQKSSSTVQDSAWLVSRDPFRSHYSSCRCQSRCALTVSGTPLCSDCVFLTALEQLRTKQRGREFSHETIFTQEAEYLRLWSFLMRTTCWVKNRWHSLVSDGL